MQKTSGIIETDMHGHISVLYDSPKQCMRLLAEYFKEGLAKNELCVFVWPAPKKQVIEELRVAGLDADEAVMSGDLRIFDMNSTYLPDGRFVADFMLDNVRNFIKDAREMGYKGLRTAGEMSWVYSHPDMIEEATAYEHDVNGLRDQNPGFTGLCLYPMRSHTTSTLKTALCTHPSFLYDDGEVRQNPFYGSPEALQPESLATMPA